MKKILTMLALSLTVASSFANFNNSTTEAKFMCRAAHTRVFVNSEGDAVLSVTRYAVASNCAEAAAAALAKVDRVTPTFMQILTF